VDESSLPSLSRPSSGPVIVVVTSVITTNMTNKSCRMIPRDSPVVITTSSVSPRQFIMRPSPTESRQVSFVNRAIRVVVPILLAMAVTIISPHARRSCGFPRKPTCTSRPTTAKNSGRMTAIPRSTALVRS